MDTYNEFQKIATIEFNDIVKFVQIIDGKLRILLVDKSFIDIWISKLIKGRYAFHWERREIDGTIYRHNNIPHKKWENIKTFPNHFHYKSEKNVIESDLSSDLNHALREFLKFVRGTLKSEKE